MASLAAGLAVLGALVGSGVLVSSHTAFERDANEVAATVLTDDRYAAPESIPVRTEFAGGLPLRVTETKEVTVVVGRPADRDYPGPSRTIGGRIEAKTGRDVTVVLEFVERQTYEGGRATRSRTQPVGPAPNPRAGATSLRPRGSSGPRLDGQ